MGVYHYDKYHYHLVQTIEINIKEIFGAAMLQDGSMMALMDEHNIVFWDRIDGTFTETSRLAYEGEDLHILQVIIDPEKPKGDSIFLFGPREGKGWQLYNIANRTTLDLVLDLSDGPYTDGFITYDL